MADDVIHQSVGFFDDPNTIRAGILPLQASPSDPDLPTMVSTTGLLTPDQATAKRLNHFDPNLFDLRPESHLSRFLRALLGDSGTGQLRKRYTVARLQSILNSTHFYDLDGFYGAIFGAQRRQSERLPINPMADTATPDEWDEIMVRDARYRERIHALAKSIPLAGTVAGLQQAAEALTGVECEIEETWRIVDSGVIVNPGFTWDDVETLHPTWDDFEPTETWNSVSGVVLVGRAGLDSRDEVYVRPKRDYSVTEGVDAREAARQRQEDEMGLQRVLATIKPAGVLLTIDPAGIPLHLPAAISGLVADSNYWEVVRKVRPRPGLTNSEVYPDAPADEDGYRPNPRPPFSGSQSHQWSYNPLITSVRGLAMAPVDGEVSAEGTILNEADWEIVVDQVQNRTEYFVPAKGIADQRTVLSAQGSADSMVVSHLYSGARTAVETHG